MTVLPYLAVSLVAKMGRLDLQQARRMGLAALVVMLVLWAIGIALIVAVPRSYPLFKVLPSLVPRHLRTRGM